MALPSLPETGSVELTWDDYLEPMQHFTVYQGIEPRSYTNKTRIPFTKSVVSVTGLPVGLTNYFAVSVTDVLNVESDVSLEVAYCPPSVLLREVPITIQVTK